MKIELRWFTCSGVLVNDVQLVVRFFYFVQSNTKTGALKHVCALDYECTMMALWCTHSPGLRADLQYIVRFCFRFFRNLYNFCLFSEKWPISPPKKWRRAIYAWPTPGLPRWIMNAARKKKVGVSLLINVRPGRRYQKTRVKQTACYSAQYEISSAKLLVASNILASELYLYQRSSSVLSARKVMLKFLRRLNALKFPVAASYSTIFSASKAIRP